MIPEEKSAGVARAIDAAFGVSGFDEIRSMKPPPTPSLVFRIVVGGSPYLLKIITRGSHHARQFASMKAAAEAGLAPRVLYTSTEDGIFITEFVEARPFPAGDALLRIPATLRRLHALAPFAGVPDRLNTSCMFLMNKGDALDGFLRVIREAKILSEAEGAELFGAYAEVDAVYPRRDAEMVSSHNDLFKPDNMLFDGRRMWLVDWEAAFLNDRYADLAVAANLVVNDEEEAAAFLREYFGEATDEYRRARFFLMQQIAHMFYAMVFLLLGSQGRPEQRSEDVPGFREFHRRFWDGEIKLTDAATKTMYGRVHQQRLSQNLRQERFRESLKLVAERPRDN